VARNDQNNLPILTNALKYESADVEKHYTAHPVTYVDWSDPQSVQYYEATAIKYAANTKGSCGGFGGTWHNCLLGMDDLSPKDYCIFSIEDGRCVSRVDKANQGIIDHASMYSDDFVAAHFKEPDFVKQNRRPLADLSKPTSVKHGSAMTPITNGDYYCSQTYATARAQHLTHWWTCLHQNAYSFGLPCAWSIEDRQCVAVTDPNNIAVVANAVRYTREFVEAHYAAEPVTYVDLADPQSVQYYEATRIKPVASGSNCLLDNNYQVCLIDSDEKTGRHEKCVWSIEDNVCVSRKDDQNADIVKHAMAYSADFVTRHYTKT